MKICLVCFKAIKKIDMVEIKSSHENTKKKSINVKINMCKSCKDK
jgi:hypothetical protein